MIAARTILVTGASGFVGRAVVARLLADGYRVRTAGRQSTMDYRVALGPNDDWSEAVAGCDAVVHAAAVAHVMDRARARDDAVFWPANVDGTVKLARDAAAAGVRQFIFISSIAAVGSAVSPIVETMTPQPETAYGRSKHAAEQQLQALSGMATTIMRPPLVYGPHVGGRFRQLLDWSYRGLPLPFGGIDNQRSYLAVDNLADAVSRCLLDPRSFDEVFNLADEGTLSTPQLLALIAQGMDQPDRTFAVPGPVLSLARLLGQSERIDKLLATLVVDTGRIRHILGWVPPVSLTDGVVDTARWYAESKR